MASHPHVAGHHCTPQQLTLHPQPPRSTHPTPLSCHRHHPTPTAAATPLHPKPPPPTPCPQQHPPRAITPAPHCQPRRGTFTPKQHIRPSHFIPPVTHPALTNTAPLCCSRHVPAALPAATPPQPRRARPPVCHPHPCVTRRHHPPLTWHPLTPAQATCALPWDRDFPAMQAPLALFASGCSALFPPPGVPPC